jgi:hypothetical protein
LSLIPLLPQDAVDETGSVNTNEVKDDPGRNGRRSGRPVRCLDAPVSADPAGSATNYRRAAERFWKDGADGIYLFNLFVPCVDPVVGTEIAFMPQEPPVRAAEDIRFPAFRFSL